MALRYREISSRDNPRLKALRALAEDARARRREQASLIDGVHLLEAALDAGWPVRQLMLAAEAREKAEIATLLERLSRELDVDCLVLPGSLFKLVSPVATPVGILAEIALPPVMPATGTEDVLALAGVQDAGNLGSLLRSAAAAGVKRIWLDKGCVDPWSPKALRAGMGAQFVLALEDDCLLDSRLREDARSVRVTSLGADSVSLFSLDLRAAQIWVFGAEGRGVPAELIALADSRVRIPMPGKVESLNVAAAAAVCLFEQVRQREC
ncbi:MAG: rRNA methyltransferase [Candidatus Dactylopiibacterium carminicum]|uniref:RNA methyltransferase n=1 Tax=Candidatus Dactylopiibacterium carminicum TaxID=857335 RepID=A0A272EQC7_9RHOO|nr:RNA methyltransferase [Candidatus Dactylopiibacterium carminicum]KAF7598555.1 RNA methyltransferase [Candidatus Dactylopiibacterium carminicum]PAS92314.1 MAG: rRNA methyltransferase [Candidatus Dactylopiibacterium carminicum]PAS95899.1 MAG: rRNA methyltransferase [Candidatus Dactylopiibacterium carminicum]PAS98115.1 MAG: hypothetical protein BSR46_12750 [Candidatus Dactylopiibacterium carminicum]